MALDRNGLSSALLTMMNNAQAQNWTPQQVAEAMAAAIDRYVRAAAVTGVVVTLPDGHAARQSATGTLL